MDPNNKNNGGKLKQWLEDKTFLAFGVVLFLVGCGTLGKTEEPTGKFWERQYLGTYVGEIHEPLPAFVARLGRVMADYTKTTGHEVCGVIAKSSDGRFGSAIYTDGVQGGCSMSWSEVPEGFVSTGETVHSHPSGFVRLNERDLSWNRYYGNKVGRTLWITSGFSPKDLRSGPGWLIEQKAFYYHDGEDGRGVKIGRIARPEEGILRAD